MSERPKAPDDMTVEELRALGFRTLLREYDAECDLREQYAAALRVARTPVSYATAAQINRALQDSRVVEEALAKHVKPAGPSTAGSASDLEAKRQASQEAGARAWVWLCEYEMGEICEDIDTMGFYIDALEARVAELEAQKGAAA
jgi:hypothetical protein